MALLLPAAVEASAWVIVMVAMMAELKMNQYRRELMESRFTIQEMRDQTSLYPSLFSSRH